MEIEEEIVSNQLEKDILPRYLRFVYPERRKDELHSFIKETEDIDSKSASKFVFKPLKWLPSFFIIPGNLPLSNLKSLFGLDYKERGLFPMDISSALAVLALQIDNSEPKKVLDLCCSPGAKFQMISERLHNESVVIGVDISEHRMATCKALTETWQLAFSNMEIPREFLFLCDGTSFGPSNLGTLKFDSEILKNEFSQKKNQNRKKTNKSARNRILQGLKSAQQLLTSINNETNPPNSSIFQCQDFDYILVDAECTHDASYRHMKYFEKGYKFQKKVRPNSNQIDAHQTSENGKQRHQQGANKRRKKEVGYFIIESDEEDFWDEEVSAQDVQKFIDEKTTEIEIRRERLIQQQQLTTVAGESALPTGEEKPSSHDEIVVQKPLSLSHNIRDLKTSLEGRVTLQTLQRSLLQNAFNLLKPCGGILVYSTCSQEEEQNEDVIRWFLERNPTAVVESAFDFLNNLVGSDDNQMITHQEISIKQSFAEITTPEEMARFMAEQPRPIVLQGLIEGTVRVNYSVGMSGHFIARIRKA